MTDKGIDNLKFGIIEQAAIDYVDLLAGFKSPTTDCNVDECRRFFRSQWFHSLCDLDPEQVINRLERKAKTMIMKYEVHKEHGSSRWYVTEVGCKEPNLIIMKMVVDALNNARLDFLSQKDKCQKQDDVKTRAKTLYDNYKLWCKSNGYYVCSMKKFNAELMAHPEWYEQKSVSGGVAVYYGIMMKTTG